jgi:hypothetical protein
MSKPNVEYQKVKDKRGKRIRDCGNGAPSSMPTRLPFEGIKKLKRAFE